MILITCLILLTLSVALWIVIRQQRMTAAIILAGWIGYNTQTLLRLLSDNDFSSILHF